MVAKFTSDLERLVSIPRLERYRDHHGDNLETAINYLWNSMISEALVQALSAMEVSLRNAVHRTFSEYSGTEYWFQAILHPNEMKMVDDVWKRLSNRHRHPPTPGQMIAELTFGFWPTLFKSDYHDLWWKNKAVLFKAVFPHIPHGLPPKRSITRKDIHERVELCKNLRNRVMHHEPIYQGVVRLNQPKAAPDFIHSQIVELLEWIDPTCAVALTMVDRFLDVFLNGREQLRHTLVTTLDTKSEQ